MEKILDQIPNRDPDYYKSISGLPISIYFSALKIMWLKDNVPHVSEAFKQKTCFAGTIDSWLIWVKKKFERAKKREKKIKIMSFLELNWRAKRWPACYRCYECKSYTFNEFKYT